MKNAIKQLSIFLENKKGELTDITNVLSTNKISIKALNLVDSSDFGILRLLVDDIQSAKRIMDDSGFSSTISEVFAVSIEDHIGSFNEVLTLLSQNDINIEYTYTINSSLNGAFIFKVSKDDFEKATKVLAKSKVKLLKVI
ncbi:amino acid-binding protein [Halarcobacter ebronensis]|uniref:Amino acid-binding protein n=1 Tax=Halarcobacter ebronensis TaxID=1462615 RepID=A0A4Q1AVS6_9BACT|nr:amino acid-binding protein [Halarcobacter ebronensis]QKF81951.1 ACT domain-containing protein [Halarcobacter ebronensis]RXK04330.1 amino acid-binding protein [Halarcobacter ebronensis]